MDVNTYCAGRPPKGSIRPGPLREEPRDCALNVDGGRVEERHLQRRTISKQEWQFRTTEKHRLAQISLHHPRDAGALVASWESPSECFRPLPGSRHDHQMVSITRRRKGIRDSGGHQHPVSDKGDPCARR